MSRHTYQDDADLLPRRALPEDLGPLFTQSETEVGLACAQVAAARLDHVAEPLRALARELATRHPEGITVADVRAEASARGILPLTSEGRELSGLGVLLRSAGLVTNGERRRSPLPGSHGNLHSVWRLPRTMGEA